jgi:hypothetical protein
MRYLLLIGSNDKNAAPPAPAAGQAMLQAFTRFSEEVRKAGKAVVSERLRPEDQATRVRVKAGHHQMTDGPFAETKEALGGFYLLECASKDEALEWAKKVPIGENGFVDVRPIWQM